MITRKDFIKVAATFGLTSTILGLSNMFQRGGVFATEALASKALEIQNSRYKKRAKFNLKFGAAGFNEENLKIERQGALFFISDIEERTDGEIRIEFIGDNRICGQLNCVKKCREGSVDLYASSTQNASPNAIYFNVLDFAYLWPGRAAQYYFFYHPKSEPLFRKPLREQHGLQFLWTHCELRNIMLGLKYKDKPNVMTVEGLKNMKLRVTGTRLGRIAMKLLGTNPIPVAWEETKTFLKAGIIDGAETWSSAVGYSKLTPFIAQDVRCEFFSGNEHAAMNLRKFEELDPDLQNAVMESAYLTQNHVQMANEAALLSTVGISEPPLPGTLYHKYSVRNCYWNKSELDKAEQMSSPVYNPDPWAKWREKLNKMAGDVDIFQELHAIAREIPAHTKAIDVDPRRWWK